MKHDIRELEAWIVDLERNHRVRYWLTVAGAAAVVLELSVALRLLLDWLVRAIGGV